MTVRKPAESPTSPRSKVATPWPKTKDFSKPLPQPPEEDAQQLPPLESLSVNSWKQDVRRCPEKGRKRTISQGGKNGSASRTEKQEAPIQPTEPTVVGSFIDTSSSSTESERGLPNGSRLSPPKEHASPHDHPKQNPFHRKGTVAPPVPAIATTEDSTAVWAREERSSPKGLEFSHHHAASQGSNEAPRLGWEDIHSPIDSSGFSGNYLDELQDLQRGTSHFRDAKQVKHPPLEDPASAIAESPNLQKEVSVSPTSKLHNGTIRPPLPLSSTPAAEETGNAETRAGLPIPPTPAYQSPTTIEELSGPLTASIPDRTVTGSESSAIAPPPPPRPAVQQSETPLQGQNVASPRPRKTSETYQIRQVNWHDATSPINPRRSPIMVQSANGPCPLLALVNALVLSTPSDLTTGLVETLRVREQVSLGLLLDAVIEELMSERRGGSAHDLPDVSDLYAFLLTLHTGMNVNPRFLPLEQEVPSLIDLPIDTPSTNLCQLGGFEDTKEMKLYSTFAIPLIHGWMPPRTNPAFEALKRAAKTYEDAQNILFREEELEAKLNSQGLESDEQQMLEDIASIKHFLSSNATQLTGYGLDSITECLDPGSISILFRNDHFSTLYKHPKTGQLFTLVTDMGYAGHDEVVWESLVDVSGEGCEFFAGDFKPVGNVVEATEQPGVDEEGWQTVRHRPRKNTRASQSSGHGAAQPLNRPPANQGAATEEPLSTLSKSTEQEDHDLALAMQLQEEEEECHRRDAAARRREDELSERYLNNADPATGRRTFPGFGRGARGGGAPPVPPRGGVNSRSGRQTPPTARPAVTRRQSSGEEAPPSYEQAAKGEPYVPPPNHPAHPSSSPGISGRPGGLRQRQGSSAYTEQTAMTTSGTGGRGSAMPSPNSTSGNLSLPRRQKGRSTWGANLENAPGVVRRTNTGRSATLEEGKEDSKKERDCCVM